MQTIYLILAVVAVGICSLATERVFRLSRAARNSWTIWSRYDFEQNLGQQRKTIAVVGLTWLIVLPLCILAKYPIAMVIVAAACVMGAASVIRVLLQNVEMRDFSISDRYAVAREVLSSEAPSQRS